MGNVWVWILVVGLVIYLLFLVLYFFDRSRNVSGWLWSLLFLSLFILLLAAVVQMMSKDNMPPVNELIYRQPNWLDSAKYAAHYNTHYNTHYSGARNCNVSPQYPRGLTMNATADADTLRKWQQIDPNSVNLFPQTTDVATQAVRRGDNVRFSL